jgi:cell division protein FtsB
VALQNFLKDEINRNERVSKALEKADDKIAKLKEENERLRGCETELHKYKDKEPEVIKYLQGYTKLMQ